MRERQPVRDARRDAEFTAFARGTGTRLLRVATLLTAEPPDAGPRARRLLTLALAHTYAHWDRPPGEDPYERTRAHLAVRFARGNWYRRLFPVPAQGPLAVLTARERAVLVLRVYEGVGEEQTAALLGLPTERVHLICERAVVRVLRPPPPAPGRAVVRRAPSWARGVGRPS
ncbi:sigma factor-like helix-turn-helix DNA-binding protein [Streptomyces sp. LaPpAH-108]|uniref:sigma factor-like helix-turn-helix DNA-binding protein n=1 Tax=Streptomyces sp. LaPpAH-108 TaxID=1155714 RepID=UPI00036786D1|nr:sigma factor-like helix-turn-helix DNA-binding protein [Streptomyces sp. LaPpAH-108]